MTLFLLMFDNMRFVSLPGTYIHYSIFSELKIESSVLFPIFNSYFPSHSAVMTIILTAHCGMCTMDYPPLDYSIIIIMQALGME